MKENECSFSASRVIAKTSTTINSYSNYGSNRPWHYPVVCSWRRGLHSVPACIDMALLDFGSRHTLQKFRYIYIVIRKLLCRTTVYSGTAVPGDVEAT